MNKYDFLDEAPEVTEQRHEAFQESTNVDKYNFLEQDEPTEQEQQFKQAQIYAKDKDPNTFAKALETGKKFGVDADFANRNLQQLQQEDQLDYKQMAEQSPQTTSFLSKPENAAIAKDQVQRLQSAEDYYKTIRPYEPGTLDYFGDLGSASKSGMIDLAEGAYHSAFAFGMTDSDEAYQSLAGYINNRRKKVEPQYVQEFMDIHNEEATDVKEAARLWLSSFSEFRQAHILEGLKRFTVGSATTVGETVDWLYEVGKGGKRGLGFTIAKNLSNSAPSIAAGFAGAKAGGAGGAAVGTVVPGIGNVVGGAVGAVTVGGASMFTTQTAVEAGAWVMQEVDKRLNELGHRGEVTPEQLREVYSDSGFVDRIRGEAIRKGMTTAAVDTILTMVGGKLIKSGVGKGARVRATQLAKGTAFETVSEGAGEGLGQVAAFKGDVSKVDMGEVMLEMLASPGSSAVTAAGTQSIRAGITGVNKSVESVQNIGKPKDPTIDAIDISEDAKVAQDSLGEINALENLMTEVGESELKDRSPEKIKEFLGGEDKKVYVTKEDFDQFFQSRGESPTQMAEQLGALEKYNAAPETGQKIEIPLAEFVSNFAGVQEYKDLIMLVSLKPDAVNANEAFGIIQGLQENLQKVSDEATRFAENQRILDEDEKAIVAELYKQSQAQGLNLKRDEFLPIAKFFRTRAENSGLDLKPAEYMKIFGLEIRKGTDQQSQFQFDQDSPSKIKELEAEGITIDDPSESSYFDDDGNEIEGPALGEPGSEFTIYATDSTGNDIGQGTFMITEDGRLVPNDFDGAVEAITVDASFRRKGIATEIYRKASEAVGKPVEDLNSKTDEGKAFRDSIRDGKTFKQDARLQRARELGFDTENVVLHGTNADFTEFRPSKGGLSGPGVYFFTDKENAFPENFATDEKSGKTIEAFIKKGKYFDMTKVMDEAQFREVAIEIGFTEEQVSDFVNDQKSRFEKSVKRREQDRTRTEAKRKESGKEPLPDTYWEQLNEDAKNTFLKYDYRKLQSLAFKADKNFFDMLKDSGYLGVSNIWNDQPIKTVFDPKNIRSVDAEFNLDQADSANIFNQADEETRGRILFGKDRKKFIIELFDSADKSTFHHETGHLFLEVMNQLYKNDLLTQDERIDFESTLQELGVESFDQVGTEQHELFARMYENYLAQGDAPSKGLRKVFAQFKGWLISIYKDLVKLNAPVSPEMKNIFDRLLATQDEIQEANRMVHNYQLFDDPIKWGMSKEQAEKYKFALAEAQLHADEKLFQEHFKRIQKEEQKAWKDMYKAEQERVAEIINDSVLYKAIAHLQKGTKPDGSELEVGAPNAKLDRDWLEANYGKDFIKRLPRGTTKKGGMDPELFASLYGFEDADTMLTSIVNAPERKTLIEETAKRQLREREGDPLTSEEISDIAMEYVENEDKFKRMKMELDFLASNNKTLMKNAQKKISARPKPDKQIKAQAKAHIDSLRVDQIRPNDFRLAERRYAKEAGKSLANNDIEAAFNAKQNELISAYLYQFAREAKAEFQKNIDWSKRIYQPDEKLAKTRDMDFVQAARALMAQYGIGKGVDQNPAEMLAKIEEYAPDVYKGMRQIIDHLQVSPKHHTELTVDEYRTLMDGIRTLWGMSKEMREVEVKGERIQIEKAAQEIQEQLGEFKKGKKEETIDRTKTKWEKTKVALLGFEAKLRRFEFVVDALDLGNPNGPFRKYLYQNVSEATDTYQAKTKEYFKKIQELSMPIASKIDHNKTIKSSELNFEFKNKGELLGALLHTGNESNYKKLLLGYGWGTQDENGNLIDTNWKQFMERMYSEEVITKEDMDYIQAMWDLMEEIKPDAQRAQKKIMGFYFDEIQATPIETPFGTYRGGYAPASIDMFENTDIKDRADFQEAVDSTALNTLPYAGGGGFTKSRTDVARKLNLNIALIPQHFKEVLRYTYVKPAVIDAHKVLRNDEVTKGLNEKDQALIKEVIIPALNRADKDKVYTDDVLLNGFAGQWAGRMKTLASMQIFFLNIRNTVEQVLDVTSAKPLMPKGAKVMSGLRRFLGNVKGIQGEINDLSTFMSQRNLNDLYEVQTSIQSVMENVSKFQKAKDFMTKNAFITQSTMQNMIENSIWISSYEQFIADGLSSDEAVRRSDSIIRRSFGSKRALDVSQAESSKMLAFFQMFMNWFNTKYNSNRAAFEKAIVRETGFTERTRALSYLYWMNFGIIAVGSEALRKVFAGTLDEDDDDEYLDDILDVFVYSHPKMAAAMIPLFGPVANGVMNRMDDKRWNDRMSATPALSMTAEAIGNPLAYITGHGSTNPDRQVKDALTTLGFATGAPLVPLAKPYKYLKDVENGKAEPSGPLDFMRGLVTGKPGKKD